MDKNAILFQSKVDQYNEHLKKFGKTSKEIKKSAELSSINSARAMVTFKIACVNLALTYINDYAYTFAPDWVFALTGIALVALVTIFTAKTYKAYKQIKHFSADRKSFIIFLKNNFNGGLPSCRYDSNLGLYELSYATIEDEDKESTLTHVAYSKTPVEINNIQ